MSAGFDPEGMSAISPGSRSVPGDPSRPAYFRPWKGRSGFTATGGRRGGKLLLRPLWGRSRLLRIATGGIAALEPPG